jgi:hypothetical protein
MQRVAKDSQSAGTRSWQKEEVRLGGLAEGSVKEERPEETDRWIQEGKNC